jgi:hypothetical protein
MRPGRTRNPSGRVACGKRLEGCFFDNVQDFFLKMRFARLLGRRGFLFGFLRHNNSILLPLHALHEIGNFSRWCARQR